MNSIKAKYKVYASKYVSLIQFKRLKLAFRFGKSLRTRLNNCLNIAPLFLIRFFLKVPSLNNENSRGKKVSRTTLQPNIVK